MALIKATVADSIEQHFRKRAMQRFGYSKGALSKAAEEALAQWSAQQAEPDIEDIGDPIQAVSGMLKNVKKTSVALQHEISKLWSAKHDRHRR